MKRLFVVGFLLIFSLFPQKIFAASNAFNVEQNEFLVQTSSGKTFSEIILVKSNSAGLLKLNAKWQGYKPQNTNSNPSSVSKHSIDFAQVSESNFELEPFASKPLTVNFIAPAQLRSGDYYGSLLINSGEENLEVNFTVRVLGSLEEKVSFITANKKDNSLGIQVKNEGNRTTLVHAQVKLSDLLGDVQDIKTQSLSLRAGETGVLNAPHKMLFPGYFQSQITLIYGAKATQATSLFSFWIWPYFFLIFPLLLFSVLLIWYLRRRKHV